MECGEWRKNMKLITSGCSFSLTDQNIEDHFKTWPNYLSEELGAPLTSKAMGSQGNGLISRSIIYEVTQNLLRDIEIRVGIMWSGTDRHEVWSEEPLYSTETQSFSQRPWTENPTGFIPESKHWQILNPHWMTEKSDLYYAHLHHEMYGWISSLEHILRTQWFLDKYSIPYFMTFMKDPVFPDEKELEHLKDLINWDKFLPIKSMYEWCGGCKGPADHPSTEQHQQFVREVILPFGFK